MTGHLLPLNGTKTHPLTHHAYAALERMAQAPVPSHEINAGVSNRLEREALGEWVDLPNPYPSSQRRNPTCPHMRITDAGRQALAARPK